MAQDLDTPLRCRVPGWMMDGLKEVAEKHRTRSVSDPIRWALEDLLGREGITAPATEQTAA